MEQGPTHSGAICHPSQTPFSICQDYLCYYSKFLCIIYTEQCITAYLWVRVLSVTVDNLCFFCASMDQDHAFPKSCPQQLLTWLPSQQQYLHISNQHQPQFIIALYAPFVQWESSLILLGPCQAFYCLQYDKMGVSCEHAQHTFICVAGVYILCLAT